MSANERILELPTRSIRIPEFVGLQDEAGAVVWDAALVLAHYLIRLSEIGSCRVSGRVCVELGAGTGAVGLVAAGLGASHVILTELPHLVPYLRDNVEVNSLGCSASVAALSWGNDAELASLRRSLPGLRPCAVLLASDVIYEAAHLEGLMRTMRALMDDSTLLLLSIEDRAPAEGWRWRDRLAGHGLFIAREMGQDELHEDWRDPAIHVLEIRCCREQGDTASDSNRVWRL
ncbi:MAG: hypothetical protein WDW36_009952 [Sanguina aurantia]